MRRWRFTARCDKGITASSDVDDISRLILPIGQRLAQPRNVNAQTAFLDDHIRPNASQKLLLRHDHPGAFDQCYEDVECAAADWYGLVALQQLAFSREESKRAEFGMIAPTGHFPEVSSLPLL